VTATVPAGVPLLRGPDPIRDVTCFACSVPLPQPLVVGAATVTRRTYDLVRIRTDDGLEGAAYAFSRGLPIARIVEEGLAPLLLGADASRPELVRKLLGDAHWPSAERGLFAVAASVVDLALWDLLGKRLRVPLADLLGRWRDEVPICAVGGYRRRAELDLGELQEELAGFVDLGCRAVKLTIGAEDPGVDVRRLAAAREVLGDEVALVVDAFRSFASLEDALRRLRLLEPFDLAYVEDPFSESVAPLVAELRRRSGMLIGLGESLSGHRAFRELIAAGAVDVVRCDATVVGGVREFLATAALASAGGLELSGHIQPNVHVHFGAALTNFHRAGLEYVPPGSGIDVFHELLATQLELRDGCAIVPDRPGLGLDWDWAAVARYAGG
jgi:L-alanine-DL-glutamate epimerase-like enolase superfamily enzyme